MEAGRRWRTVVSLLGLAALLPGCANDSERMALKAAGGAQAGHVHGFAPGSSGEVLIATHDGLYKLDSGGGSPAPVGASRHDLYAALPDGSVRRSTDDGASWSLIASF
jgi:hypothetical protein